MIFCDQFRIFNSQKNNIFFFLNLSFGIFRNSIFYFEHFANKFNLIAKSLANIFLFIQNKNNTLSFPSFP